MMEELEMDDHDFKSRESSSKSRKILIAAAIVGVTIGISLVIGLAVGLNRMEYVYVTESITTPTTEVATENTSVTAAPEGSCAGRCFETAPNENAKCYCDFECSIFDNCCPDFVPMCPNAKYWFTYRLPDNLAPSHYRLTIHPNLTLENYTGSNEMTFSVMKPTKYVIVHVHETLKIDGTNVKLEHIRTQTPVSIVRKFRYPAYQFYIIEVAGDLKQGEGYLLSMDFSNSLVGDMVGISMYYYNNPLTGVKKGIVSTDMEPTYSRRGYPCFDEPAMKVQYTVAIIHEGGHTALGNMPINVSLQDQQAWSSTKYFDFFGLLK